MNFYVTKGKTKYIALAKEEPFTSDNPDPILEPGELHFAFGNTPEEALQNVKQELEG